MTDAEYEYLFRDADPRWKAYYRMRREEYRKTHPCTNFEKWKEGLTAEWFWQHFADEIRGRGCTHCPLDWHKCDHECLDDLKWLRLANAPAKEESSDA